MSQLYNESSYIKTKAVYALRYYVGEYPMSS